MARIKNFIWALVPILASTCAYANSVEDVSGNLVINHGQGFKPSTGGMVSVGDKIMAKPGGLAYLVYDNGCRVKIEPGSIVTVLGKPLCAPAAPLSEQASISPPLGGMAGVGLGVGVLGGVGAIIAIASQKSTSP